MLVAIGIEGDAGGAVSITLAGINLELTKMYTSPAGRAINWMATLVRPVFVDDLDRQSQRATERC